MMEHLRLLDILREHRGAYISGEEISRRLSISRTAVWKQINKLREEGYEFEAVSRKGYRLVFAPDKLEEGDVLEGLQTKSFGRHLNLMEVTSSTQEAARLLAEEGAPEGTLVIAEEQTGGRGRQGKRWYSPARKGIWMSLLLRPQRPLSFAPQLTLLTAVAVCRAIRKVTGVDAGIKWPNDLLVQGKKICGILIESVGEDERIKYCIAGIGIDVNVELEELPSELHKVATSLKIESGQTQSRATLISAVMNELEQLYNLYEEEGFAPIGHLWEALSVTLGKRVTVKTPRGETEGTAEALDESGALVLLDDTGNHITIFSGDVQLA
ncbi:biotin--[acetyl-CoA-carboxylase] ligase [Paenibacillus sp. FSL R5-0407]|uniref:biotin--[acetyl-CoA-carboxylase] ligase n=1 Tax=Paenibacillus sp. FSL R5-0407 TaxID=2975320 RepID=UPI0030FA31A0